jgi:cytochrome c oxidase assembly protein subunit 15
MSEANVWLSRFAKLTVAATLCLIFIGGYVTTKDAGMSVPDWPTSFGYSMFTVPFAKWIGEDALQTGKFYEHSHRLFASMVGFLTTILAVWLWKSEPRRWLRKLGLCAFLLVVAQGVLGGLRVTKTSTLLAMIHGCTAQAFLCLLVFIAAAVSPRWLEIARPVVGKNLRGIRWISWLLVGAVYIQLVIGAVMRHLKAGLAIPTFPRSGLSGEWIPPFWNLGIALNFSHRIGALVVTLIAIALLTLVFTRARRERSLARPVGWLAFLVFMQIGLGAHIILKLRPPTITTLHVVNGAAVLATALLIALRASRLSYNLASTPVSEPVSATFENASL